MIEGQVEDQKRSGAAGHHRVRVLGRCGDDHRCLEPSPVLIRALIVEVDRSDLAEIGITIGSYDPNTGDVLPWTVVLQHLADNIWSPLAGRSPVAKLRALERDGAIRILASRASDGQRRRSELSGGRRDTDIPGDK